MNQNLSEMKTVLLIESDAATSRNIQLVLEKEGFRLLTADGVRLALPLIQAESPDLIVLDLVSRETEGPALCRELRNWCREPILTLSSRLDEQLLVDVLDAGADAYLTLPVKPNLLGARVRALLRAQAERSQAQDVIRSGDLEIDIVQRRVFIAGEPVRLTRTELKILSFLARNQNRAVSAETILQAVWGPVRGTYRQSLRVHIGHIRRKIEEDPSNPRYLITHRGGRYSLRGETKKYKVRGR